MLPPLAKLSLSEIGTKRKFGDADNTEATEATAATEAEKLLKTLKGLTENSGRSIDWVLALSNTQFDMLLSMRLYTGSLYKIMARVFVKDDIEDLHQRAEPTVKLLRESKNGDHIDEALYFALCNAKRRAPEEMNGPLFGAMLGEKHHLVMNEEWFRICAAESLTDYEHADGVDVTRWADFSMMKKVMQRISGQGFHFDDLGEVEEFRDAWPSNGDALAEHALKDFWFGMRHIASALRSVILDSKVMVGDEPMPVYRGMRQEFDILLAKERFVSVSRSEDISRDFTSNGDLDWEYDDIGAPNQCCMMRMSLLTGTPYLDMDAALGNSNGWGYLLGENELLLPPGLNYLLGPEHGRENDQPAKFPEEIDETEDPWDEFGELVERNFNVTYYTVGPNPLS